ncbi:MAG: PQQ-binding-like beta-propeller repeat protein [Thermoplasmata archaeon]
MRRIKFGTWAKCLSFVFFCIVLLNLVSIELNNCIDVKDITKEITKSETEEYGEIRNRGINEGYVDVMFDLGLGNVYWGRLEYEEGMSAINATEKASQRLGIGLEIIDSTYGKFVNSIDGKYSRDWSWWWHFLIWNESLHSWEDSNVGASSYILKRNMTIGWAQVSNPDVTPENRESWSYFRYRLGMSNSTLPTTMEIKYAVDLGRGAIDSTPVCSEGKIYVLSGGKMNWSSMEYERKGAISCIDGKNGEILWEREIDSNYGYQLSTPCVYDGKIFFGSTAGGFYCYAKNGTLLWNISCESVTSSPICDEGRVYFAAGSELYCYSMLGEKYWNLSIGNVYSSSPVIYDGFVYIGSDNSSFYCVNMSSGELAWKVDVRGKVRSTACIYEEKSMDNGIKNGIKIIFSSCVYSGYTGIDGELYCYSGNGDKAWNVSIGPSVSSPVVVGDAIFVGTNNGLVSYSITGDKRFEVLVGEVKSSPAVSREGLVVFSTNTANGSVYVIDKSGEIKRWRILEPEQYLLSSPIICNGAIYQCSDNGLVYCFGDRKPVANFTFEKVNEKGKYAFNGSVSYDEYGEMEYIWEFGDGEEGKGVFVEHAYKKSGIYNVTLKVVDDEGSISECVKMVNVEIKNVKDTKEGSRGIFSNENLLVLILLLCGLVAVVGILLFDNMRRTKREVRKEK